MAMQDYKNYNKRSSDEFPEPSPVLAALLGGMFIGGAAVLMMAMMFVGATA